MFFGKTEGATPFRFSLHVGDVGHILIVGPTGAGKSVLLALMALQFRRYDHAQIFAFDFGGSIRAAAIAMNGDWHDLGGGLSEGADDSVALQPLAQIDDLAERAWAAEWIAAILTKERVALDPSAKDHIWSALTSLASSPAQERTITGLAVLLQAQALKRPSPFTFYRGAAAVMAADLARTPTTGLRVQACGDCHLVNFGGFATPERSIIFDINDFDETLPGSWEWDVKGLRRGQTSAEPK